ncbi:MULTISPECIES: peptidoglycan recognition family protein [Megasphaera]|uniref:N-acetylmuramoyl-L-alanine amidase n=1 Tax=Megasphaera vaginalis (ex Srinivasan et al. 2021) TaxID=1111454 RepID=U7UH19_9FIRM|nr:MULTISPECIES: peptidoglycan recognition family protein [Megasphaera]ERT58164.1 N-acetylmuramoyl-L-alanine amidase [Megasphaera vaginalis (ex Srinivasan et al. 2021)]
MGRRDFLKRTAMVLAAVMAFPLTASAKGGTGRRRVKAPPVVKTELAFSEKLIRRRMTSMIIIHHAGGPDRDVGAADIHAWHLANKWAGVGYHFIVRKDGTIEAGRPMDMVGAHCLGANDVSVGICAAGNFETAKPSAAQLQSVANLTAYLCDRYDLEPSRRTIVGHRDLCRTECPGNNLYGRLPAIRQGVRRFFADMR